MEKIEETELSILKAWDKIAEGYPKSPEAIANTCNNILNVMTSSGNICVKNGNLVTADFEDEKVKVPKWYANSIKIVDPMTKEPLPRAKIVTTIILNKNNYQMFNAEKQKWINDNLETAISAIWNGYEVEEPLYIMPVPYTEEAYYFEISLIGVPKPTKKWEAQKFTEAEINEYFPKIADFKEEVEG